ncbi:hypothetical protein [Flavobacterium rivuli]|nr:hypothetical protein [Flavobacterium rivuli]
MKKLYFLPLLMLFFASCSVDDSADIVNQQNATEATTFSVNDSIASRLGTTAQAATVSDCFKGLAGHINLDVSAGLNNPVINFVSDAPAGTINPNWSFLVKVEIQQLSDCEDFSSNTGSVITISNSTVYTNVVATHPAVSVLPSQLPACYKWRITLERTGKFAPVCKSYSSWYDAPLF